MKKKLILIIILFFIVSYFLIKEHKFTVIVLPDSQNYSKFYPQIFCKQIDWILKNKDKLNIIFVSHMGDIVEDGGLEPNQWQSAADCVHSLDGIIPYGIIPGNHDSDILHKKESGFKNFDKYFPSKDQNHYIGNENNFQIVNFLNKKILFLNLSIEPNDKELEWAQKVLDEHKNFYTILTTHKYLHDYDNNLSQNNLYSEYGNSGQNIWDRLIYKNCNIKMVWSGHYHNSDGENRIVKKNICGEDVNQLVQDYQSRVKGGDGLLRIYEFNLLNKKVDVKTYSPSTNIFETDEDSQFEL